MSMHIAIFVALLATFGALVWGLMSYPEETFALLFFFIVVLFFWNLAGYLAGVLS